jgi:hypothetical protein
MTIPSQPLVIGHWALFGHWDLGLGISQTRGLEFFGRMVNLPIERVKQVFRSG